MSEAVREGITRYTLYSLKDKGVIEQVSRGIYRWADLPAISNPDFITASLRCPKAVICLISALAWHNMTTQVPHVVSVAIPRNSRAPKIDYPPVHAHRFSNAAYTAGIEEHVVDGTTVKIYNPEKTLADCFKYRNKIGMDVVLEGLKMYRETKKFDPDKLLKYASVCRVKKVMHPYIEAML